MSILIDTGPLYAFFDRRDQWNRWVTERFGELIPPFITCEAVIGETVFLLTRNNIPIDGLFKSVEREDIIIEPVFTTKTGQNRVRTIINTYQDLPASFADVCLVHMAETTKNSHILTLDNHFTIYRTAKGKPISLISPP